MSEKRNIRILVVDDTTTHLMLMQSVLEEDGYLVEVSNDPVQALEMMDKYTYNLVLLDVMMPGMDGFQVLESLRMRYSQEQLPVVVISAKTDSWSIKQALDKGANDYITKPINLFNIKSKIKDLLANK